LAGGSAASSRQAAGGSGRQNSDFFGKNEIFLTDFPARFAAAKGGVV